MKKNLLFFALAMLLSAFGTNAWAQTVIFDQHFDYFTEGSEATPATTDISGFSGKLYKTIKWNGSKVYEAGGMLMVADGGNLKTASLTGVSYGTNIKVTFDVRSRASYGGGITLASGYSNSQNAIFEDDNWHTVSMIFSGVSSTSQLTFTPLLASDGILIDNVKVEAGEMFIPAPEAEQPTLATATSFTAKWKRVSGVDGYLLDVYTKNGSEKEYLLHDEAINSAYTTSKSVTGLTEGKTYYFTVRAKKGEYISDYSNEIEVVEVIYSLPAPVAKAATNVTATGFTANWNAVEKATEYTVNLTRTTTLTADGTVDIIKEDFAGVTEGKLEDVVMGPLSGYLDKVTAIPGWYGTNVAYAKGYYAFAPFGGSSTLKTPALDLSKSSGAFSVNVNLAEANFGTFFSGGTVTVNVYNGNATEPAETKTITTESGFKDYVLDFTCGTAETYVEFVYSGEKKVFIDELAVAQALKAGDKYSSFVETKELGDVTTCDFEVPLSETVSYSYTVTAWVRTVVDGEIDMLPSNPSNLIEVTYAGSSINDVTTDGKASIRATEGGVIVELSADAEISAYNTVGQKMASVAGKKGTNKVALNPGMVIVKAGNKSAKLIVR